MNELRWHPLLRQWVAVAENRQDRPQMPANWCPFDPGSGKVPDHYEVYLYPNDFSAFSMNAPPFSPVGEFEEVTGAQGSCDVVLYSPDHNLRPSALTVEQWGKVIGLWTSRTQELFANPVVQYISIFENTGEAIGVTMPHPHGQIYAFPFVPPLMETELSSARAHFEEAKECLYCKIVASEVAARGRMVVEREHFVAFLPFFGRFPTEMSIYPRRHFAGLSDMSSGERADFANVLSIVRRKYDALYGFPMPLMMLVRQQPAKGEHPYFHFHVDFLPIQRSKTKIKYLAAVESGNGTFLNDTRAEEEAALLRKTEPLV